jgi:two-component system LytT family response regulator
VHVVTARGEFLTELTLTVLEAKTRHLVRCHKQFLVNIRQIDEIVRQDPGSALLKTRSGRQVPVSRRFLVHLKELLGI